MRREKQRGKEGWEPKKWYGILIMTCPDTDCNAGAHVRTRSKTPCVGLHAVNTSWTFREKGGQKKGRRNTKSKPMKEGFSKVGSFTLINKTIKKKFTI